MALFPRRLFFQKVKRSAKRYPGKPKKIKLKRYYPLPLIFFSFQCAPAIYTTLPYHQEKIKEAIVKVAEETVENPWVQKGKVYEIVNLEASETAQDDKLNALFRDTFTYYLLQKGAFVAERDDDIITHILFESGGPNLKGILTTKYSEKDMLDKVSEISKNIEELKVSLTQPVLPDPERYSKFLILKGKEIVSGNEKEFIYIGVPYLEKLTSSTVRNPDYILAYRIYECGVAFYDEGDFNEITREGKAFVYVELVDNKEGTVVWSRFVDATVKDKIPKNLMIPLGEKRYSFRGFDHPSSQSIEGIKESPVKKISQSRQERHSNFDITAYFLMDKLLSYKEPTTTSTKRISDINPGGGLGFVYNPVDTLGLGFFFDGASSDINLLRASLGIQIKFSISEFITPTLGLKVGWTGITYKGYGWDYLHLSPNAGIDIGKKYGGYFLIGYNALSELRSYNKNYRFDSSLTFIFGARIGIF